MSHSISVSFSLFIVAFSLLVSGCNSLREGFIGSRSPHEKYAGSLRDAGLDETALGKLWFSAAATSLRQPMHVKLPYLEAGYFPASRPGATGLQFEAKQGHRITIALKVLPDTIHLFAELWSAGATPDLIKAADSNTITYDADEDIVLILRLQPELLSSVSYNLAISAGPSLAFPVSGGSSSDIGSIWGDDRDAGARRHEGIDIFGKKGTPVVAAADGVVTRVNEGGLGGKVVWMRPKGRNLSLYYAHLDSQLARSGQSVKAGDTLGLMGNTGNARTTPPHLHFGIYSSGGAINPLPFVRPSARLKEPDYNISMLGKVARTSGTQTLTRTLVGKAKSSTPLDKGSYIIVNGITDAHYKVVLPDGAEGFIGKAGVSEAKGSLHGMKLSQPGLLLDSPSQHSAIIKQLQPSDQIEVLAYHRDYMFVRHNTQEGWILSEN